MFGDLLKGIIGPILGPLLDRIPNKSERARAQEEIEQKMLTAMTSLVQGQLAINAKEAEHGSIFVAGWRPGIGWICGIALGWNYILQPLLSWGFFMYGADLEGMPKLDTGELTTILLGMLGLGGLRTYEKKVRRRSQGYSTMTKERRVSLVWFIVATILLMLFVWKITEASRQDIEQETKVTTKIGGDSSRVFGFGGLGDVDIRDCLYSYQVFIFWQSVRTNRLCVADKFDVMGKHYAAAQMRCSVKRVRSVFGDMQSCIDAIVMDDEIVETPDLTVLYDQAAQYEEHEEREEQRDQQIMEQQGLIGTLESVVERLESEQYERNKLRQKKLDLLREEFDK